MRESKHVAKESAEDIFFGQVVISWARWFLIAAGMVLVLWTAGSESDMVVGILPIVMLLAMNFYLHGRKLAGNPPNARLIAASSMLDLAAITAVILFWTPNGLMSEFYILYYPVVLAFAFVMPPRVSIVYTLIAIATYATVSITADIGILSEVADLKVLIIRLITLGAMGGLGAYYWRAQREKRDVAQGRTVPTAETVAGS